MIGRGEIVKRAQRDGVDAQTVERDYILAHVAIDIAAVAGEHMVLKGGTSLRLAHFADYRYSADLDYSLADVTAGEAHDMTAIALTQCRDRIRAETLELEIDDDTLRIRYVGPLAARPRTIKLDLADDELVIEHAALPIVTAWRDTPDSALLNCYTLTEICAEKLRCVIQRRQCRDVYDLWTLLVDRGGMDLIDAWHRFERKAAHKGLEPQRFFDRWETGQAWYRSRWANELADYLGQECPDFATVNRTLNQHLASLRNYLIP
jgi:uncharacterized protein